MTEPDNFSSSKILLWALSILGVVGCASLQQPAATTLPDPTPATWTAAAAAGAPASDLSSWWSRFGDPALPPLVE